VLFPLHICLYGYLYILLRSYLNPDQATREDLELNTHNMQNFIGDLVNVKTMMLMLPNELDIGSKIVYLDAMEARVHF